VWRCVLPPGRNGAALCAAPSSRHARARGRNSPMPDPAIPLSDLRDAIDAIDSEILRLFTERARLVLRVGEVKKAAGIRVYDPDRERRILERLGKMAVEPLDAETVRRVFERIIDESRRLEQHRT
jgi:chorismate mutase